MAKYWQSVPRGIWQITDPVDALNAITDRDSFAEYDSVNFRIHVLGPSHKAVIIDLKSVFDQLKETPKERQHFIESVNKILKLEYF